MAKITICRAEYNEAPVSKRIKRLADKYGLGVVAFIEKNWDGYGRNRKVYKFSGFLSDFQALQREAEPLGYCIPSSWGQGFLVKE